jgi:hypothetical protein
MVACGGKTETKTTDGQGTTAVETTQTETTTKDAGTGTGQGTTAPDATAPKTTPDGASSYDYTIGKLNTIMNADETAPAVPGFSVTGMIMTGNQTQGVGETDLLPGGYKTSGLAGNFNLNEWIQFYFDDATVAGIGNDFHIVAVPQADVKEYASIPYDTLIATAESSGGFVIDVVQDSIDKASGYNLVGSGYVNMEIGKPGIWEVLFVKGTKPAQYICLNMNPATTS